MPDPLQKIPLDELTRLAALLGATVKKLEHACKSFREAEINDVWTRWSDEVPRRVTAIATFADNTITEMHDQLHSKSLGIPPEIERRKARSIKEMERRGRQKWKQLARAVLSSSSVFSGQDTSGLTVTQLAAALKLVQKKQPSEYISSLLVEISDLGFEEFADELAETIGHANEVPPKKAVKKPTKKKGA